MVTPNYYSNLKPDFTPRKIVPKSISAYTYRKTLKEEIKAGRVTRSMAINMLEDMLTIREFEEMIVKLRAGAYEVLSGFDYRGPTHLSVGQEAVAVGANYGLSPKDYITSTHRGHGDSIAKGCVAIRAMSEEELRKRVPESRARTREELIEDALFDHIYKTAAELFGKETGYCRGRGGGMHIADFSIGHLGANAIVGGGVPIATGAAMALRYLRKDSVVGCFAGDGAYANGVVLESLNWSCMQQFTGELAGEYPFGLPIIYIIINNHYGMTGRARNEVMGINYLAQRGAGFAENSMNAEVVNGMNVLACFDAVYRARKQARMGKGPVLLEMDTYRYYGHSLSDPRNEYRTKEEEEAWKKVDPIESFIKEILEAKVMTRKQIEELRQKVKKRNEEAAVKAARSLDPDPRDVTKYLYTDTVEVSVPEEFAKVELIGPPPAIKRVNGELTYKDAIKEALYEEMKRDRRVILYGEDVADYGGAFKVTKGLLEAFGRERVFNTPISEACICGTAVGAAMVGLRPVVELMYMDFALMASDQISNQAAKWHYMSGANVEVPLVIRVSVGAGKGYGGQHSQSLESVFCHIPGLYVVYPSTPYDAKGLLKAAIRDNNPVMYVESQQLYSLKGPVPEMDYVVPIGVADVKRQGKDATVICWGPAVHDALKAAEIIQKELNKDVEVVDIRSLVPLDETTILESVRKTGRCVVVSHAVDIGSYTGEIVSLIANKAFDYLDAPPVKIGAANGISPQAYTLEKAFLPDENKIADALRQLFI